MDDRRLEKIRARAHALWVAEGCPEGREVEHWVAAELEVQADVAAPAEAVVDPALVETAPAEAVVEAAPVAAAPKKAPAKPRKPKEAAAPVESAPKAAAAKPRAKAPAKAPATK